MAGNTLRHPFGNPVIEKFVEEIDKTSASSPIVLSSNIQKHFGPRNTVYLKGNLIFIDSSFLEIAIFAAKSRNTLVIAKYRLHYMNSNKEMIFRYDNASHHPEVSSFPHHKHIQNKVVHATMPSIKDILNEISSIIIESR